MRAISSSLLHLRLLTLRCARTAYDRGLKQTHLGRWLGRKLLDSGLVSRHDLYLLEHGVRRITAAPVPPTANGYLPPRDMFPWFDPLNLRVDPALSLAPRINVLVPALRLKEMSGGPNTALILAARLAARGCSIRLVSTNRSPDRNTAAVLEHVARISGEPDIVDRMEIGDGSNRDEALAIGASDVFLATAWWTAQMAKYAIRLTRHNRFVYLIQDFEPLLHAASTSYALALETYGLPHIPVVNTKLLLDYLVHNRVGRFSDPQFAAAALHFEPAIDRTHFFPPPDNTGMQGGLRKHRLLFYARPTSALRNLYELGVAALMQLAAEGRLAPDRWEVLAMGEPVRPTVLSKGVMLTPLRWLGFEAYARTVRQADVLLSLMLSPHPSYPPLEMAASGKLVVTNSFSVKTEERLREISPNMLVAEPTVEDLIAKLREALERTETGRFDRTGNVQLPQNWSESFREVVPALIAHVEDLQRTGSRPAPLVAARAFYGGGSEYARFLAWRLEVRRAQPRAQQRGVLSFITTVWNTPAEFLDALAVSVFNQDGGTQFEWVVLDNGSTESGTRESLKRIGAHPCVTLFRVEANVGIVPGMRLCLERAAGRYVLPLDSDDLLAPDCVVSMTRAILEARHPALLYTDEDKVDGTSFLLPYFKPDWDPVLFVNSCYIAHLCAFDRARALALGVYSDRGAEGCHDWDTYLRFFLAGATPLHIPEVLYSWRVHQASTSLNIGAKTWVYESHRHVLQGFVDAQARPQAFELVASPLFQGTPDWWIRRKRLDPRAMAGIAFGDRSGCARADPVPPPVAMAVQSLTWEDPLARLADLVRDLDPAIGLLHLRDAGAEISEDEWYWEAVGTFELFPDSVMIGGLIHNGGRVVADAFVFGFEDSCKSPHRGRSLEDPGYFAQLRKQRSVSAVSIAHCVVDRRFLADALDALHGTHATLRTLGLWLGEQAARRGRRVVFTPFLRARLAEAPETAAGLLERAALRTALRDLAPDARWYSPRLGLGLKSAYAPVGDAERADAAAKAGRELPAYPQWLEAETVARRSRYASTPPAVRFTVLTTVYENSRPNLLEALARSVFAQTVRELRWVIVAHGALPVSLAQALERLSADTRLQVVRHTEALCITAAMRIALAHADGDYIVPVDADDLLTPDALWILGLHASRADWPELLFSDEDLLIEEAPAHPFLRPDFDPVLNLETSYIWHLCAIRLDAARTHGLYTDDGATWCHDWDSVFRLQGAGARLVHVPEILYHWRQHAMSTSNKLGGSERSLQSVRHVLEQYRGRLAAPQHFEVTSFPIDRGAPELYLARRAVDPSPMTVLHAADTRLRSHGLPTTLIPLAEDESASESLKAAVSAYSAYIALIGSGLQIDLGECYWEVARLFELHPSVACVSGRVIDPDGKVADACAVWDGKRFVSPWRGRAAADPGDYALALKAHLVDAPCESIAFLRSAAIRPVLSVLEETSSVEALVSTLQRALGGQGALTAFSPLVAARQYGDRPRTIQTPRVPPRAQPSCESRRGLGPREARRLLFA